MKEAGTAGHGGAHGTWLLLLLLAAAPSLLAQSHGGSAGQQSSARQGNHGTGPNPARPQSIPQQAFRGPGSGENRGPGIADLPGPRDGVPGGGHGEPGGRPYEGSEGFHPGPASRVRPEGGQHLPQWFAQHGGLPVDQQEQALRREPGFEHLPPEQQQHLVDRLHRLNLQPPAQRQRMLERNERFEALPPERQQEVRGAGQALGQMPPDRRDAVRQAFRDLRNLRTEDRINALNSARFQAEYSPQERTVLNNLLSIEPSQPR